MIRTLRITSIIAAILAAVLLVCAAVYGVRSDPQIEELLQAPNALDRFTASKGQHPARDEGQVSPLVKQAADFASYLNPPPPPAPPYSPTETASPEPAAPVSAKFDLVGTSYYASHPELSLALIDEPGKGLHWVRQGSSIAHLTIEKVSDGSITVRDGQRTFEMTVKVDEQWRSLVKGAASEAKSPPRLASGEAGSAPAGPAPVSRPALGGTPTAKIPPSTGRGRDIAALRRGPSPSSAAAAKPLPLRRVEGPATPPSAGWSSSETSMPGEENAAVDAPPPTEKDRVTERVMEDLRASRISPDEAIRLLQLAETLEQLEELQKQKSAPDKTRDASSPEPNSPPDANQ